MSINKIDKRVIVLLGFVSVLALIAKPVWDAREQWQFGSGRDDAVYMVTAKSLASGGGYRQENLPGRPYLTKYPPLFPLFMSIAWRVTPEFPRALQTASILQACLLPVYLALLLLMLRQLGFSWRRTFLVAALTFVSFGFVFLAVTLFSELLFGCFLLAAIWTTERSADSNSYRLALLGGLLTGLAYLTRNAALPMLAAVPIFFFLRRRLRLSLYFFACAVPIVAAWYVWGASHAQAGVRAPYLDEYWRIIGIRGLGPHLLDQVTTLSGSISEAFFSGILGILRGLPLYHLVFAAAIAGCVRIGQRQRWPLFLIFTGLYLIMIACWWFQGLTRLVIPVWPVLLAGVAEEASHFASLCALSIKRPRFKESPRWALIVLAICIVFWNDAATWRKAASVLTAEREHGTRDEQAYTWIVQHAGPHAIVLAWKESVSYLYTGIPTSHELFVATIPQAEAITALRPSFSLPQGQFKSALLLLLTSDLETDFTDGRMDSFRATAASVAGSTLEYSSPGAYVYRFPLP